MRSSSLSALFHVDVEQLSVVTADEITLLFEVWWMLRSWLMVVNCSMFSWELGRVPGFIHLSYDRLSPSIYPLEHCEGKMKIDKQCCLHQFLSGELRVGFIGILSFSSSPTAEWKVLLLPSYSGQQGETLDSFPSRFDRYYDPRTSFQDIMHLYQCNGQLYCDHALWSVCWRNFCIFILWDILLGFLHGKNML